MELMMDDETENKLLDSPNRTTFPQNLSDGNWSGYEQGLNSSGRLGSQDTEYIFDRTDVQTIFIILYTIVFCSCFFGNLLVILVVTLHWRMRSITNFCLANLAFADLCVGVFCVYQNLSTYLIASWVFGDFLCKMYHFINSLSHTASILILVVICVERYLAIIHPMRCKQMLTLKRLRITVVAVWILSAIYSSPRLYYITTVTMTRHDGETEVICIPKRTLYDSVIFDMISMVALFIFPLIALTALYTRIGVALWRSSRNQMSQPSASDSSSSNFSGYEPHVEHLALQAVKMADSRRAVAAGSSGSSSSFSCRCCCIGRQQSQKRNHSRNGTYFYDASPARTNVITCCHCERPTGCDAIEENGNHHNSRPFSTCHQCNLDDPLGCQVNGRTNGYWNGHSDGHLKPPSFCPRGSKRRKDRHAEPIVVVRFKKREKFIGESTVSNHCKIHFHSGSSSDWGMENSRFTTGNAYGSDLVLTDYNQHNTTTHQHSQGTGQSMCCCSGGISTVKNGSPVSSYNNDVTTPDMIGIPDGTLPNEAKLNDGPAFGSPGAGQCCCYHHSMARGAHHLTNGVSSGSGGGENGGRPAGGRGLKRMRVVRSSKYGTRALRSRRRIIRMLIIIVFAFAICNLPFHARKMWQNYSSSYRGGSTFSSIFTPVTFLIMYANSGINPLLYAFMSHKFRLSFRDLLYCKLKRSLRISRRPSARSTHIIPISTAV